MKKHSRPLKPDIMFTSEPPFEAEQQVSQFADLLGMVCMNWYIGINTQLEQSFYRVLRSVVSEGVETLVWTNRGPLHSHQLERIPALAQ